jgi:hypothetical protein
MAVGFAFGAAAGSWGTGVIWEVGGVEHPAANITARERERGIVVFIS